MAGGLLNRYGPDQPTFFDPGQAWHEWERIELRRIIAENLAELFGEVALSEDCRCPGCGARLRCVARDWVLIWCDSCGWFADERWLLAGTEEDTKD